MRRVDDAATQDDLQPDARKMELVGEAITRLRIVEATYNGSVLRLSPHQIFMRNSAVYVAAFNAGKSRRHDEQPKLGGYNLAGLSQLAVTDEPFDPLPSFDGTAMRPGDHVLIAIEASS